MVSRTAKNWAGALRVSMPYMRQDIPLFIVFRALGFVSDKNILEHILYDFRDQEMIDMLRPSLEEAFPVQDQNVAKDYIGKRGSTEGITKEKRIRYASEILQKVKKKKRCGEVNLLILISGIASSCCDWRVLRNEEGLLFGILCASFVENCIGRQKGENKFLFIFCQRFLFSKGRRQEDDRDNLSLKRLDLAGPLLGGLFRQLFKKLRNELKKQIKSALATDKEFSVKQAVMKSSIITNGLSYW